MNLAISPTTTSLYFPSDMRETEGCSLNRNKTPDRLLNSVTNRRGVACEEDIDSGKPLSLVTTPCKMESQTRPCSARPKQEDSTPVGPLEAELQWSLEFVDEFLELYHLEDGWDGSNEIAPNKEILDKAFNLVTNLARQSLSAGYRIEWPELIPGFRGEVSIEYTNGNNELIIDVSPIPRIVTIRCLLVIRDNSGRTVKTNRINFNTLDEVFLRFLKNEYK